MKKPTNKLFFLLCGAAIIALFAALMLGEITLRNFRRSLESERQARGSWVMADLEAAYGKNGIWNSEAAARNVVWALMLGVDVRLVDKSGEVLMDRDKALSTLPSLAGKKVPETFRTPPAGKKNYLTYPLFQGSKEIGHLEVAFLEMPEDRFIAETNRLLLISLVFLGGLTLVLGAIVLKSKSQPAVEPAEAGGDVAAPRRAVEKKPAVIPEAREDKGGTVLADAAEELRQPVGAMQGELENIMESAAPADKEQIESLYAETDRIKKILDGMEELAKAHASIQTLRKEPIELRPFLDRVIERTGASVEGKEIALRLECKDGLNLSADPNLLDRIMDNLLSNALKAVKESGTVTVTAEQKGAELTIGVRDTGTGIKPSAMPHLFERFFRGAGSGLGLGLSIVKELVDAHNGKVEVKSELGKGSSFVVRLPQS